VAADPGYIDEDGVGGEKRRAEVDSGSGDPEVVGVDGLVKRVAACRHVWRSSATAVSRAWLTGTTVVAAIDCSSRWRRWSPQPATSAP